MKVNFTPGPSQLYFTVEDHARTAFREGIPSISHRSKDFEAIFADAVSGLRTLLNIPADFSIVFTSSATEIWERSLENLVEKNSLHFVNGAFSKRYYEIARQLDKTPAKIEVAEGLGFKDVESLAPEPELIAITHNETSTGVSMPLNLISSFRETHPGALVVVDAVSSLPYPQFDFTQIDSLFFSVQKGFGLPAGLGVWIVNGRCIAKAESMLSKGKSIGSYHSLPGMISLAKKNQTSETPNVLGIYLLSKVVADFNRRGITTIRRETEYKSAILYQALDSLKNIKPFVADKALRSHTVVVADCGTNLQAIADSLHSKGLRPGDGYGKFKGNHLRFANFPAHSKEQYEMLVDTLLEW